VRLKLIIFSAVLYYDDNGVLTYNGGRTQGDRNRNAKMWVGDEVVDTSLNITNFKSWLCGQGVNHWGNAVEFRNSEASNPNSHNQFCFVKSTISI
jgi:hypothetical protein